MLIKVKRLFCYNDEVFLEAPAIINTDYISYISEGYKSDRCVVTFQKDYKNLNGGDGNSQTMIICCSVDELYELISKQEKGVISNVK